MISSEQRSPTPVSLLLVLVSGLFTLFPVTNTDIWWHLASAREMLATGSLLTRDPFAYTPTRLPWVNIHWLFQIVLYGLHRAIGMYGLLAVKMVVTVSALRLLCQTVPRRTRPWALAAGSLLLYEYRYLLLVRPTLISLVGISALVYINEKLIDQRPAAALGVLALVQGIWANMQGLAVLGPIICGTYLLGEVVPSPLRQKTSAAAVLPRSQLFLLATGVSLAAMCLTPHGPVVFAYPFLLLGRISPSAANLFGGHVSENAPIWQVVHTSPRFAAVFAVSILLWLISLIRNRQRFRPAHLLLGAGFLFLAIIARRNLILWAWITPMLLFVQGEGHFPILRKRARRLVAIAVGAVLTAHLLLHLFTTLPLLRQSPLSPFRVPQTTVEYLENHPIEGHVFNSIRHGGYIVWRLPHKKVFIDGRLVLRSSRFFREYLAVLDTPALFDRLTTRYTITHVVLPLAVYSRYLPLALHLFRQPDWDLLHCDGTSLLFALHGHHSYAPLAFCEREVFTCLQARQISRFGSQTLTSRQARRNLATFRAQACSF